MKCFTISKEKYKKLVYNRVTKPKFNIYNRIRAEVNRKMEVELN